MRWIANYFRQVFCKHDWLLEEGLATSSSEFGKSKQGVKVSATCKKCGYHRSYWKYL
jgi:RNase P subunit RPR2